MKDSEAHEGEGRVPITLGESRVGPIDGDLGLSPSLQVELPKDCELEDEELPTKRGGKSTETSEEPALSSRSLDSYSGTANRFGKPDIPFCFGGFGQCLFLF